MAVCDVNRAGEGYYYPERFLGRETARRWIDEYTAVKTAFRARYANGIELTCETNNASYAKFEGTRDR